MGEWKHFASNAAIVLYLSSASSVQKEPFGVETSAFSAQQTLRLNRLLLRLGHSHDPATLQTILEQLVSRLTGPVASRPNSNGSNGSSGSSTSSEFTRQCLYYQMELLRSSFPEVRITPNHKSLLLLELSHALFDKGFTKSALSTIRTAESLATSPTMKGVCRLEELRLTSANEDESKRFTILRAMCSILENGREDCDGDTLSLTNPSQSWREKEALSAELAVLCKRKRSFSEISRMAHELYKSLDRYLQSTEFTVLEDTMNTIRQELSILKTKSRVAKTRDEKELLVAQQSAKQLMLSEYEKGPNCEEKIQERLKVYRDLTLQLYLRGLGEGEQDNKTVYHFISLWFQFLKEEDVTQSLQELMEGCPVAPFVPLAHQIVSRVGVDNRLLLSLITRMTQEYPFHLIPFLLPLYQGLEHEEESPRKQHVLAIIQSLSDETASLVRAFESLFRAYHRLILQSETSK
ncbi:hypothetical protein WA556_003236, partial [Blastocystis sp. ATCC 50177/Nand II]